MAEQHKARVGERIREAREAKDWSQSELAKHLPGKVDGPSVSRWERGLVYPEQYLDHLAGVLEVDVSFFLVAPPDKDKTPDLSNGTNPLAQINERLAAMEASMEQISERLEQLSQDAIEQALADAKNAKPGDEKRVPKRSGQGRRQPSG